MAAKKLYLLDANVLITANRDYYPMGMVPEFWDWLLHMAKAGVIKMPLETYEEVRDGGGKAKKDDLVEWLNSDDVRKVLELPDEVQLPLVGKVVESYSPDLDDAEIEQLGRDPFLIAHALADPKNRVVVSIETSAPGKKRANRKVPDVCKDNGVECCNTFAMLKLLGFSTKWKL
ncbi:conserved protein of unknown function (plasmid) [Cupriavidus taiwanensis]|uniref:PIN domain-containing protein n=1 Tax=Cupriavidus taiwanensis TaxID=164546 RepID=A0A375ECP7_9BURK|nr:DUF4411 family protein [Cupriavidus taiwanensis]SOZ71245.1 conserved protein of unknown function [Cupriavidus taiwanensis]SOZ72301.1 conserved protein of unknown function [Cupriavidus taiwanensis]SOZ74590.1 conserved protein of unknown function [Cupriavidus taiwanensis]SPA03509.1 conserved protein of unknown function [Cupriavidus taiwanensis]SPA11407.1 conserved protein of unknown function [Cupriavidus taiwanensis]